VGLAQPRSENLPSEAVRSVTTYNRYTVFDDVRVHVEGGMVTLSGKVTLRVKKDELGKRIAALAGVMALRNEIEVLPSLPSDEDLRHRVARAIYSHAAFWRYAAMPTPPIRILVEHGRVTLTGVVATESDRMLARSLATGLGESSLSCDLRTER
jgi:osmotically-inducible protein OsmY